MARKILTPEKLQTFLELLRQNGGVIKHAARDLGVSQSLLYRYRDEDEEFAADWAKAVDRGIDVLEDEARRWALDGVREPVYHNGKPVGFIRKKSATMMIFMLKGYRPNRYRERFEHSGPGGEPLNPPQVVLMMPSNGRGKVEPEGDERE